MRRVLSVVLGLVVIASVGPIRARAQGQPAGGAQPPASPGEVRGIVLDSDASTPIARASVAVRTKADGALITGAIAGPDGSFRIQGLRPGAYTLRVTYIGYGPKIRQPQPQDQQGGTGFPSGG